MPTFYDFTAAAPVTLETARVTGINLIPPTTSGGPWTVQVAFERGTRTGAVFTKVDNGRVSLSVSAPAQVTRLASIQTDVLAALLADGKIPAGTQVTV